jgi:orotidine-5'-phosphate decarboxylase
VFALVKTSNPSSAEIQDLDCGGAPLYERVGALVEQWGAPYRGECSYSLLGAVVGATFPAALEKLRRVMPHAIFLLPGYGAQGARAQDAAAAFDSAGMGAVVSSSRGIIYAYREKQYAKQYGLEGWQEAVRAAARQMRDELWAATHAAS